MLRNPLDPVADPTAVPAPPRMPARAALLHALFTGLSEDDRDWVVDRIAHYRALAAANQAPEGRI